MMNLSHRASHRVSAPLPSAAVARRRGFAHSRRTSSITFAGGEPATYADLESINATLDGFPTVEFFQVTAVLRPWRLNDVVSALVAQGIKGLTVSDVYGIGFQGGKERYGGSEFGENDLIQKKKLDIVCVREQVSATCQCIAVSAFTGEIGDGKIFVSPVSDIIRMCEFYYSSVYGAMLSSRTAETGSNAERMSGGRSDLLNAQVI